MISDEHQQVLDDLKTLNLVRKNTDNNGKQETSTKNDMNWKIKQIQTNLYAQKKRLANIPYENDSDEDSVDPYYSFKGRKAKNFF